VSLVYFAGGGFSLKFKIISFLWLQKFSFSAGSYVRVMNIEVREGAVSMLMRFP
jgi:hypothetical protein